MSANQKKQRKYDRNRKSGQNSAYKLEHRQEKSHILRIRRHLERYGIGDNFAKVALMNYATQISLHATNSAQEFIMLAEQVRQMKEGMMKKALA